MLKRPRKVIHKLLIGVINYYLYTVHGSIYQINRIVKLNIKAVNKAFWVCAAYFNTPIIG